MIEEMSYSKIQNDDKIGSSFIPEINFSIKLCQRMHWKDVIDLGIS